MLGGTSLFGGVGTAFGAVVGSVLVQMVQAGMVFIGVNLYLQPMVLAGDHLPGRLLRRPPHGPAGKAEATNYAEGLMRTPARVTGAAAIRPLLPNGKYEEFA